MKSYSLDAVRDKILELPGSENLEVLFNQFSGYLAVQGNGALGDNSKNLHYWFVESRSNPSTDPIAFWTNGGPGITIILSYHYCVQEFIAVNIFLNFVPSLSHPFSGCSGLIAFFTEQGPFRPNADGSLSSNSYEWNKVSNMVFIESPAGVGFSHSDAAEDLKAGDDSSARDNYNLIQSFFSRFPEYRNNSMYLTSESYGGHYIPTLAKIIVDENTAAIHPRLNLKGIAIGNPYTDEYSGMPAMLETIWGHQLVSKPVYDEYKAVCALANSGDECYNAASKIIDGIGNLNPYALDFETCSYSSLAPSASSSSIQSTGESRTLASSSGRSKNRNEQKLWLLNHIFGKLSPDARKLISLPVIQKFEPCEDDYTLNYLSRIDVKRAIHVKEDIVWASCSK